HKNDMAASRYAQISDLLRELLRGQHLSLNSQRDHIGVFPEISGDAFPLLLADLFFHGLAGSVRRFFISHLNELQPAVASETLAVLGDGVPEIFLLDFSHG